MKTKLLSAVIAVALMAAAGCLRFDGVGEARLDGVFPLHMPDPAAVLVGSSAHGRTFRVFATPEGNTASFNIPAVTVSITSSGYSTTSLSEGLAERPTWAAVTTAPTVRWNGVRGDYTMFFTGIRGPGSPACIGAARSAHGWSAAFVRHNTYRKCSGDFGWGSGYGLLDPQLFRQGSDHYLLFSRQSGGSGSGHSGIWSVRINPSTLQPIGSPSLLLTYDQAVSIPLVTSGDFAPAGGCPAVVENPHIVSDPHNPGGVPTMTVSVGRWCNRNGASYVTAELPCLVSGPCFPSQGALVLRGVGGVSVGVDTADTGLNLGVGAGWLSGDPTGRRLTLYNAVGFTKG